MFFVIDASRRYRGTPVIKENKNKSFAFILIF